MKTWLIEAVNNPQYNGKTYGVPFQNGKAMVNNVMIEKSLGRKAEEIVKAFQTDFPVTDPETGKVTQGYRVKLIDGKEEAKAE